ncbi:MAG: molybdopterin-synthase adenylyltransferase MoeB [Opitutae bacterium]|nr:molybdopterin-synthase adenylyltransferase MoeB [Opitutae bacterium]
MSMNTAQLERYSRHLLLPEVGMNGQEKLLAAKVLIVGAGGLGCPSSLYLAAAGVGRLGIVDFDKVDASNLQRQVLFETGDVGKPKVDVAKSRINAINPDVQVDCHPVRLDSLNALDLFKEYDLVVDGTDNFATRYLVNDACVLTGIPNVYGSIFRFEGQVTVFAHSNGPCYRCLFPQPPKPGEVPNCAEGGVLGVLPGMVGVAQATEAVKLILGKGNPLLNRLLIYDALAMRWKELKIKPDPECPVCGDNRSVTELIDYEKFCGAGGMDEEEDDMCGDEIVQLEVSVAADMMRSESPPLLVDVRTDMELQIARISGSKQIELQELSSRWQELDGLQKKPIILHCHHGMRSHQAAMFLQERGFSKLYNMAGGIDAWSHKVDPEIPRY